VILDTKDSLRSCEVSRDGIVFAWDSTRAVGTHGRVAHGNRRNAGGLMSVFESASPLWNRRMLGLLRIVAGLLFITHGIQKTFGYPPSPMMHLPVPLSSLAGVAGVVEIIGGTAIVLGLFTRVVAFILAGEMAVAYFTQHFPRGSIPLANGGELAVLYCFFYLYLVAAGPGSFSIDSLLARTTSSSPPAPTPRKSLEHAA
jgi:putative oxidoreductase